ncbi:hypothetical protein ccbrp13_08040 [Ktedonobacteria bacterium brp13]|nr:hypothetical protein ccbrp13_08040 [Ktedonobacteria bacterium brp13]
MNNISQNSVINDVLSDEEVDETDKIDEFFTHLLHIEPPTNMVERIMQVVSQLPQPRLLSHWKDYDFFIVENDIEQCS